MTTLFRQNSSSEPTSTSQLRRMLEQALLTDAELEAFCLDYFPVLYRQFSRGMERTHKLNLLLVGADPVALLQHLRSHAPTVVELGLAASIPVLQLRANPVRPWGRSMRFCRIGLGVAGVTIFFLWLRSPSGPSASSPNAGTPPAVFTAGRLGSQPADFSASLTSDPASALVVDVPSGRLLGQTPWAPDATSFGVPSLARGLRVCLRKTGFVPMLVTLEPGADPSRPRPTHVRLQRESRAAKQRDLGQETCNVPTPIIQ